MIRTQANVSPHVLKELRRIIEDSDVTPFLTAAGWSRMLLCVAEDTLPLPVLMQRKCFFAWSQLLKEDDNNWPPPDRIGRQELEIILGDQHISFTTTKLGSLAQVTQSKDPEGLKLFYYLVQVQPGMLAAECLHRLVEDMLEAMAVDT